MIKKLLAQGIVPLGLAVSLGVGSFATTVGTSSAYATDSKSGKHTMVFKSLTTAISDYKARIEEDKARLLRDENAKAALEAELNAKLAAEATAAENAKTTKPTKSEAMNKSKVDVGVNVSDHTEVDSDRDERNCGDKDGDNGDDNAEGRNFNQGHGYDRGHHGSYGNRSHKG